MTEELTRVYRPTSDDRWLYRRHFPFDRGLWDHQAFLLDPCSAVLDDSMHGAREAATDADRAWHRKRRKIQAELNTLEAKARGAVRE